MAAHPNRVGGCQVARLLEGPWVGTRSRLTAHRPVSPKQHRNLDPKRRVLCHSRKNCAPSVSLEDRDDTGVPRAPRGVVLRWGTRSVAKARLKEAQP
ncbi:hypothetical protein BGZ61DRAFT_443674 [Ilyonectria robusta]|uniref:uncharacterized protein n=1 Tax=Ilyonectria robusta TaxID=1079257 RepID=UPI001E8CE916|nr:uncharacterized protein BGZ61DRAFT_443674 [Ilyonectria robusta]KAH8735079.1 hypothetical protein BGZ61DRAFT_443674 [Ilyonectria robusta]